MTSYPEHPRRVSPGEARTTKPVPEQPVLRVPSPTQQSGAPAWGAVLALLAIAIIVAGVAAMFILELWLADRIIPGVYVWDVDVGGLDRDQAVERLSAAFHYPDDRYPTLRYGEQVWPVDPADLGMQLDVAATVDAALAIGHRGELVDQLKEQLSVLVESELVAPVFTFEQGIGTMFISQLAQKVNQPLRNASLSLGEDLSVTVSPGRGGREVDGEATRQALIARIEEMGGGAVALVVRETEPLLTDLGAVQAQVQRILSSPITLTAPDSEPWIIEPATLAGWLILQPTTGDDVKATLSVTLDPGQASALAQEISSQVERPPTDAQFRFDDAAGTLVPLVDSVPGQTLDIIATMSLIETAANGDQRTVELPLTLVNPSFSTEDAAELGIVELIGEGTTSFAGSSASRVQNIIVGASQFDGVLVAPGETFSFNQYLGEVTAEKGYEESIIIWGNTTRADVGGGLCQVSSTAFRAAFWAGLPVAERWAHAFRVSYYEPPKGLDATIYSPSVDLKWVNDTGHHILIQTYVDRVNNTLTFRYYGTNPGRTVEMDGPYEDNPVTHGPPVYRDDPTLPKGETKQIEWAKDGLDVTVYRIIKEGGVEVQRETFFSRYRPWQAVYLVGTKEEETEDQSTQAP
jgi:vancomycin resistance protein YoaR